MEATTRQSFCLNFSARELDHFAPLLDFISDEPGEVGRRAGKRRATELGNPCLRPRIGKRGIELLVEPFHDLGRLAPWRANAIPPTNCCPSRSDSHWAIKRAAISPLPPAAKPWTKRTGRVG